MYALVLFALLIPAFLFTLAPAPTPDTAVSAAQTVPHRINYQGRLTDNNGQALADGDYNIRFRIYDAQTGGTQLWSTSRTGTDQVTVSGGTFSIQLGAVDALPDDIFTAQTRFLEVELPTPSTATSSSPDWSEGPFTPRQRLNSSPYAFNADEIDGIDSDNIAILDEDNTFTGSQNTFQNSSDSTTAFQVQNAAGSTVFNVDTTNQRVGVGTGSPNELLTLDGRMSIQEGSAPSSTAGYGKLYVKSGDSTLYFMNDSGTEFDLTSGGSGGSPGGSDGEFQYNDGGSFGGAADLFYENTSGLIGVGTNTPDNPLTVSGNADITGNLGIGTTSPSVALDVSGGVTASGTLTLNNLDCTTNANGGALTTDSNGVVSCSDDDSGSVSGQQTKILTPEFAGGTLTEDGTDNIGTMTADHVSGLASGEGHKHNYYQWSTSETSAQDYEVVITHALPNNFNSSNGFATDSWQVWTYVDSTTDGDLEFTMESATGTTCVNSESIQPSTTATWEQITLSTDPEASCSFAANDIITLRVKLISSDPSSNNVRLGGMEYSYDP